MPHLTFPYLECAHTIQKMVRLNTKNFLQLYVGLLINIKYNISNNYV